MLLKGSRTMELYISSSLIIRVEVEKPLRRNYTDFIILDVILDSSH